MLLRTLLIALLWMPLAAAALERGAAAPPFELEGSQGTVKLSDYRGQVLYLDFWASWCAPCRQSFPWMNELLARYQAHGLRVLAVNVDKKRSDADRFLQAVPARFDLAFDAAGNTPKAFAVKAMPSTCIIGADGKVVEVHSGFAEEDKAALEKAVRQALKLP
jgi:peroxiredoxin